MRQAAQSKSAGRRHSVLSLSALLALIAFFAAVPVYGVIRDILPQETVFVLESPLSAGAGENEPAAGIIGRIYDFLFPKSEIGVAVKQRIDLNGRVVYSDGTPYAGGVIALQSEPRYTTTDADGSFVFEDVEEGTHTLSVLDGSGAILAQSVVVIERVSEGADSTLTRLPDGTYLLQVSVDIRMIELTITLNRGADGSIGGIADISLGFPSETPAPTVSPTPTIPVVTPPGGGSSPPVQTPPGTSVYDVETAYVKGGTAAVNIFGEGKRLAPGMKGSYRFTVDNAGNAAAVRYDVTFTAADTLPEGHKIPMRYRLRANGVFIAGGEDEWCTAAELYQDAVLAGKSKVVYTLDWCWPDSANDNDFAAFGGSAGYSYSLTISVTAQG